MADVQYPTYRYHAEHAPVIVNDEAEDKALGKGWHDAPVAAVDEADEAEDAPKKGKGKK